MTQQGSDLTRLVIMINMKRGYLARLGLTGLRLMADGTDALLGLQKSLVVLQGEPVPLKLSNPEPVWVLQTVLPHVLRLGEAQGSPLWTAKLDPGLLDHEVDPALGDTEPRRDLLDGQPLLVSRNYQGSLIIGQTGDDPPPTISFLLPEEIYVDPHLTPSRCRSMDGIKMYQETVLGRTKTRCFAAKPTDTARHLVFVYEKWRLYPLPCRV